MKIAFILILIIYMCAMVVTGLYGLKKEETFGDFLVGGGKIHGVFLGMAAQVSDVCPWILFLLPGMIYIYGAGRVWIGVGLFLGMLINWQLIPYRMKRYSARSREMFTVPEFFGERFKDDKNILKFISSSLIIFFTSIFTIAFMVCLKNMISCISVANSNIILFIIVVSAVLYTVIGGMKSLVLSDLIQGGLTVLFLAVIIVLAFTQYGPVEIVRNIMNSGVPGGASIYMNVLYDEGVSINPLDVISEISLGMCCIGTSQTVVKFIAMPKGKSINKGRRVAVVFTFIVVVLASVAGVIGRAILYPEIVSEYNVNHSGIFTRMIEALANTNPSLEIICAICAVAVIAAGQAVLDTGIFTVGTCLYNDVLKGMLLRRIEIKNDTLFARISIIVIGFVLYVISAVIDIDASVVMRFAWIGLGVSLGPVMVMSLSWRRMNIAGAAWGFFAGPVMAVIWNFVKIVNYNGKHVTLNELTGLGAVIPAFLFGVLMILFVSLITKDVSNDVKKEFEKVKNRIA